MSNTWPGTVHETCELLLYMALAVLFIPADVMVTIGVLAVVVMYANKLADMAHRHTGKGGAA